MTVKVEIMLVSGETYVSEYDKDLNDFFKRAYDHKSVNIPIVKGKTFDVKDLERVELIEAR